MKKILLAAIALTTAASVFAQGTVVFNNGVVTGSLNGGNPFIYAPDRIRPAFNDFKQRQMTGRATWRASERNKFDLAFDWESAT